MSVVERSFLIAIRGHCYIAVEKTGTRDNETWSNVESYEISLGQMW